MATLISSDPLYLPSYQSIRLGLYGESLSQSLSPQLHTYAARSCHRTLDYHLLESDRAGLNQALCLGQRLDLNGANVTSPHKEVIFQIVDHLTSAAHRVRAVNTLRWRDGVLEGHNTDLFGFKEGLSYALSSVCPPSITPMIEEVILIGAGGASRGVIAGLADLDRRADFQLQKLTVCSRAPQRGLEFIQWAQDQFKDAGSLCKVHWISPLELSTQDQLWRRAEIIILSTPPLSLESYLSISPNNLYTSLSPSLLIYDLNYGERAQGSLSWAKKIGARWSDGLLMLVAQGVESFTWWTGDQLKIESILDDLQ